MTYMVYINVKDITYN